MSARLRIFAGWMVYWISYVNVMLILVLALVLAVWSGGSLISFLLGIAALFIWVIGLWLKEILLGRA